MKKYVVLLLAAALSLPTIAVSADHHRLDPSPQLFLYVKVPFGKQANSVGRAFAPQFGMSLNREFVNYANSKDPYPARLNRTVPMIDLRFARDAGLPLQVGGMRLDSDGRSVWKNPWLYVGIAAGVLLASCVSENFPCEDSDGGGSGSGGGGGGY